VCGELADGGRGNGNIVIVSSYGIFCKPPREMQTCWGLLLLLLLWFIVTAVRCLYQQGCIQAELMRDDGCRWVSLLPTLCSVEQGIVGK
jgi:hypothetical protein